MQRAAARDVVIPELSLDIYFLLPRPGTYSPTDQAVPTYKLIGYHLRTRAGPPRGRPARALHLFG